ncbi:AzlD domain-containing protein [Spongisporangium articulatum]|uniref:AzlD domain-containing protein n=1 Tax=Spongisporangium articulatum TaxID=3362603 RepID=A0ABW8AMQ8_9ACTN
MSTWTVVLLGCAAVFVLKLAGHLVPARHLERPAVVRAAAIVTAGLLAALVTVQTLVDGERLALDARVPAVGVAAVLLWRRAPFIVVVAAAALTAALLRL